MNGIADERVDCFVNVLFLRLVGDNILMGRIGNKKLAYERAVDGNSYGRIMLVNEVLTSTTSLFK